MSVSLEDRIAIGDLVSRYNYSGDSGDVDTFASLFAPDALFQEGDADIPYIIDARGPDEIWDLVNIAKTQFPIAYARHWISSHTVWEEGGKTLGKCYLMYVSIFGDIINTGTYFDEYVKIDGTWRFKSRVAHIDGTREQFETNIGKLLDRVRDSVPA